MSTATINLYTALVKAGVDEVQAEKAAESVVTRDEAVNFATKADVETIRTELHSLNRQTIMWMAGFHLVSFGGILTVIQLMIG